MSRKHSLAAAQPSGNGDLHQDVPTVAAEDKRLRDNLVIPEAEIITPRKGELLDIPEVDLDEGDEEDIGELGGKPIIANPPRRTWLILNPANFSTAKLLAHKEKEDDVKTDWYYVALHLQKAVRDELVTVRVIPYISVRTRICRLWVRAMTVGNSWYESLQGKIFCQPPEFFEQFELRVKSYRPENAYIVSKRTRTVRDVTWPAEKTNDLLKHALGTERMIADESHPLYQDLVSGTEV
jgi:hypothetical protein